MNAERRRPARDQALAAGARGLPLRRVTATMHASRRRRADRRVLRPGLAAGRARRVVARELSPRPRRVGGWLGTRGTALLRAGRGDVEALARRPVRARRRRRRRSRGACRRCAASTGCSSSAARVRDDPTLRVARRSGRAACRRRCPRSRSRRCSPRPTSPRRSACATARCWRRSTPPGCASPSWSASRSAQVGARRRRRARDRQGQQGAAGAARRRGGRWLKRYLAKARPELAGTAKAPARVPDRAARAADAPGVLGADQALRACAPASRRRRCRRTCCATRSRRIC